MFMLFLYVKCRNWRDSRWDAPAVLITEVFRPHCKFSLEHLTTTIQLQPLVLRNVLPAFPPALPQIALSSLSPIALIWPLQSWFRTVLSRSWTNWQICQETQEGTQGGGLSERAGYLRGCSQETLSVSSTSYPKPETSRGWAGEFIRASCLVDTGERWEVWK